MFLLVPAYPGCPGSKAVKRLLLLLLIIFISSRVSVLVSQLKGMHMSWYINKKMMPAGDFSWSKLLLLAPFSALTVLV